MFIQLSYGKTRSSLFFRFIRTAVAALGLIAFTATACADEVFVFEKLPYSETALEPFMSAKTLSFHHGKHYKGYIDKVNKLIKGTPYSRMSPEDIIKATVGKPDKADIFNNAAQAMNHALFWKCMKQGGGGEPSGKLADMIKSSFGSYGKFKEEFSKSAAGRFGSGWVWLVQDGDKLKVMSTSNAYTPLARGLNPILGCDVWEHSYYLDYQNRRGDYVSAFLDKLVDWDAAEKRLK
jgi:Fe-Mn family superoxide dismutase